MGLVAQAPLMIAGGAALAAWLVVFGFASGRLDARFDRRRRLAKGRGEEEVIDQPRRERRTPRLALRRPRRGSATMLRSVLKRIGVDARPTWLLLIVGAASVTLALVGNSYLGGWGLVGGVVLGTLIPIFWMRKQAAGRRARINGQLEELLQVASGGLTAGQSFLQALSSGAEKIGDPFGTELRVMLNEVELGSTLEDALSRLRDRVHDEDLDLVIDAVLIQRRVGGNLAEVLTNISWTIRERIRIRGEVKALTGQARMSGWMLSLLPFGIAGVLFALSPEYMMVLFDTRVGRILMAIGITAEVIGFIIMRKIADIKV